ncbi:radical SAM domain protein [Candidatus Moduliflexus flocculans]|uniref:Radical SAM domain protein n=1 Tax=Candidatus Moduliflexus flocculans TaxID=1499966 RepID=A0A0S6W4W4_9BACT|nr:radical SAM domain protein [Candidatus Moduliflexus flocculans]
MTQLPYAVAFLDCGYNRYSIAALTGAVEVDERLQDAALYFPKIRHGKQAPPRKYRVLYEEVVALAQQHEKLVVACSFTTANFVDMRRIVAGLRDVFGQAGISNALFVAGGPHASGDPEGTLRAGFDAVVVGEGEITFPDLLVRYFHGQSFADMPGLGLIESGGAYRFTGRPALVDLGAFPPFAMRHRRFSPIEISRGCPNGCRYCQTPFFMGGVMRHRSLDCILDYTERAKRINLKVLRFISPNSFAYGSADGHSVNLLALETLLRSVSEIYGKPNVFVGSFPSEVRPEHVSPETLGLIRRFCANENLVIGAQSGSEHVLERIHRGHSVAEIINAAELTIAAGFVAHVDFMFGLPGETEQDRKETLNLMTRLVAMGAKIHGHAFMPLVGTPFAAEAPGEVDSETRLFMDNMQGKHQAHGRWRQQERLAKTTAELLASDSR